MRGSLETPPIVIHGDVGRSALIGVAAGALVAIAIARVGAGQVDVLTLVGLLGFGAFAAFGLMGIVRPARLVIDPSSLAVTWLGATRRYNWGEVSNFEPVPLGLWLTRLSFSLTRGRGGAAYLWGSWEIRPAHLAALLNQARERWGPRDIWS